MAYDIFGNKKEDPNSFGAIAKRGRSAMLARLDPAQTASISREYTRSGLPRPAKTGTFGSSQELSAYQNKVAPTQGTIQALAKTAAPVVAEPEANRPMDLGPALAIAKRGALGPQGPSTTSEQDDASRSAAETANNAKYAGQAAQQDSDREQYQAKQKEEKSALEGRNLKDSITNATNELAYLSTLGPDGNGKTNAAAAKIRLDMLLGQQGALQKDRGLDSSNQIAQAGDRTTRRGQDVTADWHKSQSKDALDGRKFTAEQARLVREHQTNEGALGRTEAAKIRAAEGRYKTDSDRENKITKAESEAYNTYLKANPNDEEGAFYAGRGAGALARGKKIKTPGQAAKKGKTHWYGNEPDSPMVRPEYEEDAPVKHDMGAIQAELKRRKDAGLI